MISGCGGGAETLRATSVRDLETLLATSLPFVKMDIKRMNGVFLKIISLILSIISNAVKPS
jgi:hypothetical protein